LLNKGEYISVFLYVQQATENALLGFLEYSDADVFQEYEVIDLMRLCSDINNDFEKLQDKVTILSHLYLMSRHRDESNLPTDNLAFEYAKERINLCYDVVKRARK